MSGLPQVMTEGMLLAAHEAAHASRTLPWREAEQARWTAVIAAMPTTLDDGARLSWLLNNLGRALDREFAAHVLRTGGLGDQEDFREFIDSQRSLGAAAAGGLTQTAIER